MGIFTCVFSSSYLQLEGLNLIQTLIPELLRKDLEHGTNPRSQERVKDVLASKGRAVALSNCRYTQLVARVAYDLPRNTIFLHPYNIPDLVANAQLPPPPLPVCSVETTKTVFLFSEGECLVSPSCSKGRQCRDPETS